MSPPHHRRHLAALKAKRDKTSGRSVSRPGNESSELDFLFASKSARPSAAGGLPSALTAAAGRSEDNFFSCESDELRLGFTPTRFRTPFAPLTGDAADDEPQPPNKAVDLPSPKFGAESNEVSNELLTTPLAARMPRVNAARFSFMPVAPPPTTMENFSPKSLDQEKEETTLTTAEGEGEEQAKGKAKGAQENRQPPVKRIPTTAPETAKDVVSKDAVVSKDVTPARRKVVGSSAARSSRHKRLVVDSSSASEAEGVRNESSSREESPELVAKSVTKRTSPNTAAARGDLTLNKITPRNRPVLAAQWYARFNSVVFGNRLPQGLQITWNPRARRTAGFTRFTRLDREFTSHGDEMENNEEDEDLVKQLDLTPRRQPHDLQVKCIDLSTKLLTDEFRLAKTLLHECCHVAQRLLEDVMDSPHGPFFKKWAALATAKFPQFKVSRCHDYTVQPPHQWICDTCAHVYKRFSKSIDPSKHACGVKECKGHLRYIGSLQKDGLLHPQPLRIPSAYQAFVKANYHQVYKEGSDRTETMRTLAAMWKQSQSETASSTSGGGGC